MRKRRKSIGIDKKLAKELKEFAERKHGFVYGAVKTEAEAAIRAHIMEEA